MSLVRRFLLTVAAVPLSASASVLGWTPRQAADLSGVVSDANGVPIAGAEVILPSLPQSTFTNDSGRYRFADVPPGLLELRVRRIGYSEFVDVVTVPDRGTVERKITLRQVQTLTPVTVSADPAMTDFDENRRIGLGRFLTRVQLEPMEHRKLGEIIEQVGARVRREGPHAWVFGRGGVSRLGGNDKCAFLEGHDVRQEDRNNPKKNPGCGGCFAQVYLDDALLYNGEQGHVVPDINFIQPQSLEGIEFYRGPSQTPLKYSRLNSQCGVLVLHTRRTMGSVKREKN